jgi:hypothetical protein
MIKGFKEKDDTTAPFICKTILIVLLIGIVARLLVGFLVTHVYDIQHWGVVMQNINSGNGLYEITGFFYTPSGDICWVSVHSSKTLSVSVL